MRKAITYILLLTMVTFVSCERNFDIKLKDNQPQLIVEGYINNQLPEYNYVVLGRSQSYFEPGFENIPVTGAVVTVTEGTLLANNTYNWDLASKRILKEGRFPQFNDQELPGVYFDPMLKADPTRALIGKPGKHYLLEIEAEGKQYSAITTLLPLIPIDSVTSGFHFLDEDEDEDTVQTKARLTVHYKDPDTIGNTQLYYWSTIGSRNDFGWGGMGTNRFTPGTDDLVNGQYIHLTLSNGFAIGDSVNYYLVSVERKVYNFWDSFNKARSNAGPFATPVSLMNTISGNNVIGCFSGFSMSTKSLVVQ
ncbi:hypothetical protein A4H97_28270 [Niastella yeongjuensis]|uniref:DUF4249 domain-containing protein n=1 Tax=Niastella yeongjuensis TaxID=354355 RepID=A0A1V9EUF7_9BACT|nr:DUF4249 domain-containing protein [Niastella yeongjuensis]OQP49788.1 hypothetical protein A4H97_28270 [Niastella yeongjuensis]SEP40322.1 protein of unknown function [Niastella yeongjuensis]